MGASKDNPINFENVVIISQILASISQLSISSHSTNGDQSDGVVFEVTSILEELLEWDHNGLIDNPTGTILEPAEVAIRLYGALDNLANLIMATENSTEPVLIVKNFMAVKIFKKILTKDDIFDNFDISNTVIIYEIRPDQIIPNFTFSDNVVRGGAEQIHRGSLNPNPDSSDLFLLSVKASALSAEFAEIRKSDQ